MVGAPVNRSNHRHSYCRGDLDSSSRCPPKPSTSAVSHGLVYGSCTDRIARPSSWTRNLCRLGSDGSLYHLCNPSHTRAWIPGKIKTPSYPSIRRQSGVGHRHRARPWVDLSLVNGYLLFAVVKIRLRAMDCAKEDFSGCFVRALTGVSICNGKGLIVQIRDTGASDACRNLPRSFTTLYGSAPAP